MSSLSGGWDSGPRCSVWRQRPAYKGAEEDRQTDLQDGCQFLSKSVRKTEQTGRGQQNDDAALRRREAGNRARIGGSEVTAEPSVDPKSDSGGANPTRVTTLAQEAGPRANG